MLLIFSDRISRFVLSIPLIFPARMLRFSPSMLSRFWIVCFLIVMQASLKIGLVVKVLANTRWNYVPATKSVSAKNN